MSKKFFVAFASFVVVVSAFTLSVLAQASPDKKTDFPTVRISNFGQLDERFFRGARPKESDFAILKSIGIDTIIDLTDNTPAERALAEAAGLKYINIPIKDKTYATQEIVDEFLKVANDPATGKFYVHCAGGRHRTGNMGAVYRFQNYGWNYAQVMQEMENFDFYTSYGHSKQKDFVVDYAAKYQAARTAAAAMGGSGGGGK